MDEVRLLMGSGQSVAKEDASIVHSNSVNQSPDLIIGRFDVVFTRIPQFVCVGVTFTQSKLIYLLLSL